MNDQEASIDSGEMHMMEHKVDNSMGQYHSAYEIYEEKLKHCETDVKNLKDKIDDVRQKTFHYVRRYFKDGNYYNSLTSSGNGVTRLESHSNSHTSEAGHNESINNNTQNNNNDNNNINPNNANNPNGNNNNNNYSKNHKYVPKSRQAAEERLSRELNMKIKIRLQGHGNKVYAIDWHKDNAELISAARDAKCMIWNVETGYRKTAFNLDTEFTMDCKYSPDCSIVACGGLDDTCSIYKLTDDMGHDIHGFKDIQPIAKLQEHGGYISSIAFVDNNRVLTASGDQTLILWDINKTHDNVIDIYGSHWADVMSVSVKPDNENIFVSGSTDYTCRVWDIREKNNSNPRKLSQEAAKSGTTVTTTQQTTNNNLATSSNNNNNNNSQNDDYFIQLSQSGQFDSEYRRRNKEANPCVTHIYSMNNETDVNYVKWFPKGYCFAAGNEDGVIKLYDIRSNHCLNEFSFQESLGYVNPLHPETVSNPNVTSQYSNLLNSSPMYGLNGNGNNTDINNGNSDGNNNTTTTTNNNTGQTGNIASSSSSNNTQNNGITSDEDSRDRLKNANNNIENTTELSHLRDLLDKYDTDFEGVACLDFSKSGQYLFASYNGTSAILVWDVITGRIVERMQEHNYHIPKVSMSPDGRLLAASCWDKTNYIYSRKPN